MVYGSARSGTGWRKTARARGYSQPQSLGFSFYKVNDEILSRQEVAQFVPLVVQTSSSPLRPGEAAVAAVPSSTRKPPGVERLSFNGDTRPPAATAGFLCTRLKQTLRLFFFASLFYTCYVISTASASAFSGRKK